MAPYTHLPHRHPFLMVDAVTEIEEGKRASGIRHVTIDDPAVLPGGRLPEVFVVEALAQLSGIATGNKSGSMLAGLNNMSFARAVHTGETIRLESSVVRTLGNLVFFECRASVSGETVSEGGVILHFNEIP